MTATNTTLTFLLLGFIMVSNTSCRIDDRTCEAGSPELFGTFTYSPGQTVLFKDSLQRQISVTFNNTYTNSNSYTIKGKNALSSSKIASCIRSSGLNARVTCIPDTLLTNNRQFSISYQLDDDNNKVNPNYSYSLIAFQSVTIAANISNGAFTAHKASNLSSFTTPYKTYSNLLLSSQSTPWDSKLVYNKNGKLIAFTLNGNPSTYFYLVE
jgi:YD repeat-containing protein